MIPLSLTLGVDNVVLLIIQNILHDFHDTACVVGQLDLVISVDTAVAHLAGAMDIPVWTMLQHNADFRWMRGRSDSPWYRSMTLIRQRKLGDWDSVLDQIQNALSSLLGPATVEVKSWMSLVMC